MIPGALLVLAVPLVVAPVVYLLRRLQSLAALVAGLTTAILGWLTYVLPLDQPMLLGRFVIDLGQPVSFFDRPLVIEAGDKPVLVFMFLVATALFWFAWRVDEGPVFFAMGLVLLSLFGGVLLMQPFQYAALLLALSASVAAFLIQGGRAARTQAAMRYMIVTVIALPPILVAGWELDKFLDTPDQLSLVRIAAVLFACTFFVLLSGVPFHGWVPAVGADAPPLVSALILSTSQAVVVSWMLSLFNARPDLLQYVDLFQLMGWAGLSMIAVGGLLAFSRASFGRLLGYAALIDMGVLLVALGMGTLVGLEAALMTLVLRAFGLVISAAGLSVLRTRAGGDRFEQVRALGWRMPFATAALILGGLSLAGFPLTPGFVGRWALLRLLAPRDTTVLVLIFLAGISVAVGYLRGMAMLFAPPEDQPPAEAGEEAAETTPAAPENQPRPRGLRLPHLPRWDRPFDEPLLTTLMLVIGIVVLLAVAVAPQLILPWVERIAALYTFF
jgi:NADH:ubiquinone oxidoreductase subunit 2 (subunit N)